jgi:DNA-binding NtrC family response regulator
VDFSILIVDDELEVCLSLSELLENRGFQVRYETNPENVPSVLASDPPDCILMDIRMPGTDGIELLSRLSRRAKRIPVIMISGNATVDSAVRAMRFGAVNVFTKPIAIEDLVAEISRIERLATGASEVRREATEPQIVTADSVMRKVLQQAERAAPTDATVLITGESGTGKELVAQYCHCRSGRGAKPLLTVNCAAIPDSLLESEIFGHEKGAFTDARDRRLGLFERAVGGTVFLDEIADMSAATQAKMLRVIQEKRFSRLGGSEILESDCRIIAATNRDLVSRIAEGRFREDLYYRLTVIHLHLPPLRERPEDIPLLARHFLGRYNVEYRRALEGFSEAVLDLLQSHTWPGNVRELQNIVQRAAIFASGPLVGMDDLPEQYSYLRGSPGPLAEQYQNSAREVILEALRRSGGRRGEAARILKVDRKTLYNRMKKLNLDP